MAALIASPWCKISRPVGTPADQITWLSALDRGSMCGLSAAISELVKLGGHVTASGMQSQSNTCGMAPMDQCHVPTLRVIRVVDGLHATHLACGAGRLGIPALRY